jgi:hypothetical protein
MIARRQVLGLAAGALAMALSGCSNEPPVQPSKNLAPVYPLLVDLPGWSAGRPTGAALNKFGVSMTMAVRGYRRGEARLTAQVVIMEVAWTWRGMMGIKAGRDDPIGEPQVIKIPFYDTGMVSVILAADTKFNLTFQGITSADALVLARRFDWKAIQAALPKPK